jgi:hypothetical protein
MTLSVRKKGPMSNETSDEKKATSDFPIGYGKPPAQTRFKKGQSGNPTGRPKGTPNFATALERALGEQVIVNEGGQRRTVTKLVATVTQLVNKAVMGDLRATKQLMTVMQALDGEPNDVNEVPHPTESDALVIAHLLNRLGPTKGAAPDDPHS